MLSAEFRKTWSHPVLWVALIAACLAQFLYVTTFFNPDFKEFAKACNAYAGTMDDAWQERILSDFNTIWNGTMPEPQEYWDAPQEQRSVLAALESSRFSNNLEQCIAGLKAYYGQDPDFDLGQIDAAYSHLRTEAQAGKLNYGISPAGSFMVKQHMVTWCFVLFMMILCIDQFSSEQATGMDAVQLTSKRGRKQLYWTKLAVCQLSASIVWLVCNGVFAAVLTVKAGWGIMNGVIQDFTFNASPFAWNSAQYLSVVLTMSFFVSQIVALVIFCLANMGKSATHTFGLIGAVFVFPMLMAKPLDSLLLYLWLPNLMDNAQLWTNWSAWRIGQMYIQPWMLAITELVVVLVFVLYAIGRRADQFDNTHE